MNSFSIFIFLFDLSFIDSVKLDKNFKGLRIYLFKNKEKINIKSAIASTVLIIKFFLSSTAIKISFACSETFINPTRSLSISILL